MIIGLLAKKGFGKDTAGDYLVTNYGFKKVAFAEPLKDACAILFGFTDEQLYGSLKEVVDERWGVPPRKILQYLGTDILRNEINTVIPGIGENFWINRLKINCEQNPDIKYVISDVRFQNEVDWIHEMGGVVIKIDRPILSDDRHGSEKNIDLIENYDKLINNDGSIEEFYEKIDVVFKTIINNISNLI